MHPNLEIHLHESFEGLMPHATRIFSYPELAIDTETTGLDPYTNTIVSVQIANNIDNEVHILDIRKDNFQHFFDWLKVYKGKVHFQNAKFDLKMLKTHFGVLYLDVYDTELAERLLFLGLRKSGFNLALLAEKYLGIELDKSIRKEFTLPLFSNLDLTESQLEYGALDAWVLPRIAEHQLTLIKENNLEKIADLEFKIVPIVAKMELHGFKLDVAGWTQIYEEEEEKAEKLKKEMFSIAGTTFNPNSHQQIKDIFRSLDIEVPVIYGKETTKEDYIISIDHPFIHALLEYRHAAKNVSTYGKDFLQNINPVTGRIHAEFNQLGTDTGRFSSDNPNMQNIPKRADGGTRFRKCFIAAAGNKIVSADFCLIPGTKILTRDLRWTSVDLLEVGDELIGITENREPRKPRRYKPTKVTRLGKRVLDCVKITLSDGSSVTCSNEHPWLSRNRRKNKSQSYEWVRSDRLGPNWEICSPLDVWCHEKTWESGYISGMLDGEGTISNGSISISQRYNPALELFLAATRIVGFDFVGPCLKNSGFSLEKTPSYWLTSIPEMLRLLGTTRPARLIENSEKIWNGKYLSNTRSKYVVSVESVGPREVVSMETDSHTFLAEGLVSHNSQQEVRLMAEVSQDPELLRIYKQGLDRHTATAAKLFEVPYDKVTKQQRRDAKDVNFGTSYGASAWKIATTINKPINQVERWLNDYWQVYQVLQKWSRREGLLAWTRGYSETLWGRRRHYNKDELRKDQIMRMGANHVIQGSAGDMIKLSMYNVDKALRTNRFPAEINNQVHDELELEVQEYYAEDIGLITKIEMERAGAEFIKSIDQPVDVDIGDYWL